MLPQRMFMAAGNPANKAPAPAPQPSYPLYLPYGYFGGGYGPGFPAPTYSTVDRIDYANDTVTAVQRGPLSAARYSPGGAQNCPL